MNAYKANKDDAVGDLVAEFVCEECGHGFDDVQARAWGLCPDCQQDAPDCPACWMTVRCPNCQERKDGTSR